MSLVAQLLTIIGILVSILTVVIGFIVRATTAFTELRLTVRDVVADLQKHVTDERGERIELRTAFDLRLDRMADTLSRVDRDVARLSGRRRDAGTT